MVSVLGRIATAVHVGGLPRLDPTVYQASAGIPDPTPPLYRLQGPPQVQRQGNLEDLHTLQGLVALEFLETVGWQAGCPSVANGPLSQRGG